MKTLVIEDPQAQERDVLRYADAAALLSMPLGTLYALVSQQRIPHYRLSGRTVLFRRQELLNWLSGHAVAVREVTQ